MRERASVQMTVERLVGYAVTVCMLGIIAGLFLGAFVRNVFSLGYPWLEDALRYLLIWIILIGGAALSLRNDHISMEALYERFPPRLQRAVDVVIGLACSGISAFLAYLGYGNTARVIDFGQRSRSGALPAWIGFSALPVSFALVALGYVYFAYTSARALRDGSDREDGAPPGEGSGALDSGPGV